MIYSVESLHSLGHQFDQTTSEQEVIYIENELYERTRAVLHSVLPKNLISGFMTWAHSHEVRFVGEAAVWVGSGDRLWRPRSLEILVPDEQWDKAFGAMVALIVVEYGWKYQNIAPAMYPAASGCVKFESKAGCEVVLYRAAANFMLGTLDSSPYSHYCTWFRRSSIFCRNALMAEKQVSVETNGGNHEEASYWASLEWNISNNENVRRVACPVKIHFMGGMDDDEDRFLID